MAAWAKAMDITALSKYGNEPRNYFSVPMSCSMSWRMRSLVPFWQ